MLGEFGYTPDGAAISGLADELRQLSASVGMVGMLTGAFIVAKRYGFGRAVGA